MKNEKLERLIRDWKKQDEKTLMEFGRVFWDIADSYRDSREDEYLNLKGWIEEDKIPAAARLLRMVGITEFTATPGWADPIRRLRAWDREGFKIAGFIDLPFEGKKKTIPALLVKAK